MDRKEKAENSVQASNKSDAEFVENDMSNHAFTLQNTAPVDDDFDAYEGGNAEIVQFAEIPGETTDAFPDATVAADEYSEPVISTAMKESDMDIDE